MKVVSIRAQNFKTIRDLDMQDIGGLTVLIGKNNSGKTNVLETITYFSKESYEIERFSKEDKAATIHLELALTPQEAKELGGAARAAILVLDHTPKAGKTATLDGKALDPETVAKYLKSHVLHIDTARIFLPEVSESGKSLALDKGLERLSGQISFERAQRDFHELKLTHPKLFTNVQEGLKTAFPNIHYALDEHLLTALHEEREHPEAQPTITDAEKHVELERMGAGYLQIFSLILYAYHPKYSILLIDEPETHLHPALQKKLLELFRGVSAVKQIFLTTHSPSFVSAEHLSELRRVVRTDSHGTEYFPKKLKGVDVNRLVQELNPDSSELFFADVVLLVEGEADRILMRGLLERFGSGTREIKVVATHSNTNFEVYDELLSLYNIPHVIMTDFDSLRSRVPFIDHALLGKRYRAIQDALPILATKRIVVLPFGALEDFYPKKYQNRPTKPLNALNAAQNVTEEEYTSKRMMPLRRVVELCERV
ncbi:MAG: AAA family ATPase [Candidatus Kerfeldbacteria bacterium]|nr:AAA family ATPase [Candidatus Kerfeldbacteria bacterium]